MKELTLDGGGWSTKDDVCNAFFRGVGASEWHGTNSNAPDDSIANGSINELEVPYTLVFINYDLISGDANEMTDDFVDLIHEMDGLQLSGLLAGGVRESRNDNPTGNL
jgi:hypothetical protein